MFSGTGAWYTIFCVGITTLKFLDFPVNLRLALLNGRFLGMYVCRCPVYSVPLVPYTASGGGIAIPTVLRRADDTRVCIAVALPNSRWLLDNCCASNDPLRFSAQGYRKGRYFDRYNGWARFQSVI